MGTVTILEETNKKPLELIGKAAGECYGSDTTNEEKNYKRGLKCIRDGHGRVMEFADIYMIIDGYSARVIRELYTHIGGAPTRLQASTRYIDYANKGFKYIVPPAIKNNKECYEKYCEQMKKICETCIELEEKGVSKEDVANLLPLGMTTKISYRVNFRTLVDMSHQRMCTRAYWEFRQLFNDIAAALKEYSPEYKLLVDELFMPKCEYLGYCKESQSCGRKGRKE